MFGRGLQPEGQVVVHGLHTGRGEQQEVRAVGRQAHRDALLRPAAVTTGRDIVLNE